MEWKLHISKLIRLIFLSFFIVLILHSCDFFNKKESAKVLLVGADGLDLGLLNQLIHENKCPTLESLIEEGAYGVLYSERPMRSPAIWTTIATGRTREAHGIYDFVTGSRYWPVSLQTEEQNLVTSDMRRVPALWNILSGKNSSVAVIGWLNSWPAEKIKGLMVSPYVALGNAKQLTIKGNVYKDESHQVYPENKWPEIKSIITTYDQVPDMLFSRFAENPPDSLKEKYPVLLRHLKGLRGSLAHSLTMRDIALHVLENGQPDLTMVYFEGADTLGHRFWLFRQPMNEIKMRFKQIGYESKDSDLVTLKRMYGKIVDTYYEFFDHILRELIEAAEKNTTVIIVSDHGFGKITRTLPPETTTPFGGDHRLEGTIIIAGKDIYPKKSIPGATIYDVTPTVLHILNETTMKFLEGHSLLPYLTDNSRTIPGSKNAESQSELDSRKKEEELERLRSLGYIK
jgi:predicted AlkP superfamily phosphohydrolase/phosphomutase